MSALTIDDEPGAVGLDPSRLERIGRHFDRYVADGRLVGYSVAVSRRQRLVHVHHCGMADPDAGRPVADDTLWRIYSMTKPITSVAAMTLFEEGAFELNDPVSRFLPAFGDMRVWAGGTADDPHTVPATEPIRMWHLLSHTAGLTYGFMHAHPVDELYRAAGFDFLGPKLDLAASCDVWAGLPLLFQPGTSWGYSVGTDVLGRVLEVITGKSLDAVVSERVVRPLGMDDTVWWAEGRAERLAALYAPYGGSTLRFDAIGNEAQKPPVMLSGGGGLLSTVADYVRFAHLLVGGGRFGDARILGPRTLDLMTQNHLPGGRDLASFGSGQFAEVRYSGVGFGLGFAPVIDPVRSEVLTGVGEFSWGGAASTAFFIDPYEELAVVFMTQLLPSSTYPIRSQLRGLVYQAIVE